MQLRRRSNPCGAARSPAANAAAPLYAFGFRLSFVIHPDHMLHPKIDPNAL
jgi:hypothetical protein